MKQFAKSFCACGLGGWCIECFWTGLHSLFRKDKQILCRTSYWMFPIYGAAALLAPLMKKMKRIPIFFRGTVYMVLIFLGEFLSGSLLKKHHSCPWDYSKKRFNVKGVIRLDYAPAWFFTGLLFEWLIHRISKESAPYSH